MAEGFYLILRSALYAIVVPNETMHIPEGTGSVAA